MPKMLVVAGPIGSGKTRTALRAIEKRADIESFNVDDRCAELNEGSYQNLPDEVITQAVRECRQFIQAHIEEGKSFVVETTLGSNAAISQAKQAKEAGFEAEMMYIATEDPEINVRRTAARERDGGRQVDEETVRSNYHKSIKNLPKAMEEFDRVRVYDNSIPNEKRSLQLEIERGKVTYRNEMEREWVAEACRGTEFSRENERGRER